MKRVFTLSVAIIILLLSACSYTVEVSDILPNTETITVAAEEALVESVSQATMPATKNTEIAAKNSAAIEDQKEESTKETEAVISGSVTNSEITTPEEPLTVKATGSDCAEIANLIIAYINDYRSEEGNGYATKLPGLTEYAEYRSRQLVTNFAHDTFDERAAATALQYGQYIDPKLYGTTGEPYYTANAREAIAKTTFGGTVDVVAMHIARMARNSADHWRYVGNPEYSYIAVGVTYEGGTWYCCIRTISHTKKEPRYYQNCTLHTALFHRLDGKGIQPHIQLGIHSNNLIQYDLI